MLKSFIEKTPGLTLAGSSTDPLFALNEVMVTQPPDLTFLDVDMPELSGIEFAGLVNEYTRIVFTTSYREYAIEAFEKEAEDYLLKPIAYERFLKAVKKVKKNIQERTNKNDDRQDFFLIKSDIKGKMIKIIKSDIILVEAMQNYVRIKCTNGQFMAYLTLAEIEAFLPKDKFSRVHRSFIISNQRIRTVEQGQVTLEDNSAVTLGRSYKEQFLTEMKGLLVQSKRKV
jgi:DNA-binding LytR/AlgR family response regulator